VSGCLRSGKTGCGQFPLPRFQLLSADPCRFSPIVLKWNFPKPGMLQRLLSRDALSGVVDEYLLEQIQEQLEELVRWGDDILRTISDSAMQYCNEKAHHHLPEASSLP
jgi:hypothetical protein